MKLKQYKRVEDPGHSWLEVPIKDLNLSGAAAQITPYSYRNNAAGYVWLEEDCDLPTFYDAMKNKGYEVKMISHFVDDFDNYLSSFRKPAYAY